MPYSEEREETTATACERCGGRGWIVVADGGAGTARQCPCRQENVVPRLLAAAGVPARYRHCRLRTFHAAGSHGTDAQLLRARTLAQQYVDEFVQPSETGGPVFKTSGLLFTGPPGVGKTHLAVGILVELIERYRIHGRFVEFTSLLHQIQSTFDPGSPESKREILDPLAEAELLVLDELGAQQATPWVRDILYLIINGRYTRRKPTLFTTNYRLEGVSQPAALVKPAATDRGLDRWGRDAEPPREEAASLLTTRLPPMLVSRLYEMAQPVALDGVKEDFRREHAIHGAHLR
ncbi:MAG TPA: ATP-binding protein [Thermoanaerobaculia bacterium]|nr:ATP-binding protein [Thermoanaerobaculia bacterium]